MHCFVVYARVSNVDNASIAMGQALKYNQYFLILLIPLL